MKTLIKNARIVTYDKVICDKDLLIVDGKIAKIDKNLEGDKVIDAQGGWLIPGFVDLHCHGGDGYEFMDANTEEIAKICDFHLKHGTTTLLATTLASSDYELESALLTLSKYSSNTFFTILYFSILFCL